MISSLLKLSRPCRVHFLAMVLTLAAILPKVADAQSCTSSQQTCSPDSGMLTDVNVPAARAIDTAVTPLRGIALTATQRAAIRADWEARRAAFTAIVGTTSNGRLLGDTGRSALRQLVEARNVAVLAILTPNQRAQLKRNLATIAVQRRLARPAAQRRPQ